MTICPDFDKDGVCREGVDCKFNHDYQKPLTTSQLRIYLDTLISDTNRIRDDLSDIKQTQDQLAATCSQITDSLGKVKRSDQDLRTLTNTVSELVDKLKDAGISQLNFDVQPAGPQPSSTSIQQPLSVRAHNYLKPKPKNVRKDKGGYSKKK